MDNNESIDSRNYFPSPTAWDTRWLFLALHCRNLVINILGGKGHKCVKTRLQPPEVLYSHSSSHPDFCNLAKLLKYFTVYQNTEVSTPVCASSDYGWSLLVILCLILSFQISAWWFALKLDSWWVQHTDFSLGHFCLGMQTQMKLVLWVSQVLF